MTVIPETFGTAIREVEKVASSINTNSLSQWLLSQAGQVRKNPENLLL